LDEDPPCGCCDHNSADAIRMTGSRAAGRRRFLLGILLV
jgi:hypothetical protein